MSADILVRKLSDRTSADAVKLLDNPCGILELLRTRGSSNCKCVMTHRLKIGEPTCSVCEELHLIGHISDLIPPLGKVYEKEKNSHIVNVSYEKAETKAVVIKTIILPDVETVEIDTELREIKCGAVSRYILTRIGCGKLVGRELIYTYQCSTKITLVERRAVSMSNAKFSQIKMSLGDILKDLATGLGLLAELEFTHGGLTARHIVFDEGSSSWKIAVCKHSSITYPSGRLIIHPVRKSYDISDVPTNVCGKDILYMLTVDKAIKALSSRRDGRLLYPCSIEAYCILLTLGSDPVLFEDLHKIWKRMWSSAAEQRDVENWCVNMHSEKGYPSFNSIVGILKGKWLSATSHRKLSLV